MCLHTTAHFPTHDVARALELAFVLARCPWFRCRCRSPAPRDTRRRAPPRPRATDGLVAELISGTLDEGRDRRAASAQALGQLRVVGAQGLLADENPAVRLQVLIALERIDPDGTPRLPELERLARDRQHWRVARLARGLLRERTTITVARSAGAGGHAGTP